MNNFAEPNLRDGTQTKLRVHSAASTKGARGRQTNQDSIFHWTGLTEQGQSIALAMVCDGLGGHAAGDLASRLAVETISAELVSLLESAGAHSVTDPNGPQAEELGDWISAALRKANSQIYTYANSHREALNMGTTITLAALFDNVVEIANVGDSRTYLYRDSELTKITRDHSFVAELVENGLIQEEEAAFHPKSNVILRALGTDAEVDIDLFTLQAQPGDILLLCCDGFWKPFPYYDELGSWFRKATGAADLCKKLAAESYRRSGSDDTSLAILTID